MPEKELVSVLAIFYHGGLPRFAFTGHGPVAARHSPLPACFGFVFHPQARAETIQPQAAMSFALIPDWLRLAPFLVPVASLASARCARVRLPRSHPRPLAARRSLRIHWPLTTGH